MSFERIDVPAPKNGRRYRGVAVCRISTEKQNEMSLDDQGALYRERLPNFINGEYDLEMMATQGSGEILDRSEFIELSEKVAAGEYDFVIAEDLGRIARRIQVMILCEEAEDTSTRIIAINDRVDTLETDSWRQNAFFATMRHESYNRDTSKRIKRSHRNRFANGEMVRQLPAGYVKPHSGATEAECYKAVGAQEVYDEWFRRLERDETFAEIACWLNSIRFPLGSSVRKHRWDGTLVGQTTRNPILKGLREHNRRTAVRVNKTGRRKSIPAPKELLMQRECPHLAFIDADRYDRVIRMLKSRNAKYTKGIADANSGGKRNRGTRNDSRWPSQHVRCGICGRKYVLGGHGRKDRMMCDGARSYQCWNAMTVDRALLASGVAAEVHRQIETLPEFDSDLIRRVSEESEKLARHHSVKLQSLNKERSKIWGEIERLTEAVATVISSSALLNRLMATEERLREVDDVILEVSAEVPITPDIPTADEIRRLTKKALFELAADSREFADIMRSIVRGFYVLPYRLIDGGSIMPRAVFNLDLGSIAGVEVPQQLDCMSLGCTVDLMKQPQRVEFRRQVVSLRESGLKEREVAAQLGITQPAVQYAAKLHREMKRLCVSDPWQPVLTHHDAANYFKRISHARFCFTPLDGFTTKFSGTDL